MFEFIKILKYIFLLSFNNRIFVCSENESELLSSIRLKCEANNECSECLQQFGCVWCLKPKGNIFNHCISQNTSKNLCEPFDIINPKTGWKTVENSPLKSGSNEEIVQIKPQKMLLDLKVGQSFNLNFQYSQAENYPVDLYYIIDNSYTMRDHKKKLAELGSELAETMQNITNDFRVGFGSFIDKIELPYVSTVPEKLADPCPRKGHNCIPAYSFKNHLSLTTDFARFSREVRQTRPSGNLDNPEGGFDAIIQAIVCKNEIGWRPQARHFIVFSTDATFHLAGDGKLAGIIETNDGKCHMKNNIYNGLSNDYPSVSYLNYIAKENNINLIFAIVKKPGTQVSKHYKELSDQIENSKTDELENRSKNVVQLVVNNYKKIVNSVTLKSNASDNIEVKITPHCSHKIREGCTGIGLGETVNFTATFKLLKCENKTNLPTIISLKPDAINASLIVEVRPICSCKCEEETHPTYKKNSAECSGQGHLVCGNCECNENRRGSNCECDKNSRVFNDSNCRMNQNDPLVCSGLGICRCGKCECKTNPNTGRTYRGKFCDCDDDSCDVENGLLCGEKGTCSCGKCICNAGWSGPSCGCKDTNTTCIPEGYSEICSGKGNCNCGKCECVEKYTGTYCEVCPTCLEKCINVKDCVECTIFQTGIHNKEQCNLKCVSYKINTTNEIQMLDEEDKICRILDEKKCEIIYKYRYDELENLYITVLKEKKCEPNLLIWVSSVIGMVLLIGLLTLILWKIITTFHDKREYIRFVNEQKESKWHNNQNPLYKHATTTFQNPNYTN